MLDSVALDLKVPKPAYRMLKDELVSRLILLQQAAIREEIPAIVLFEGWDAAGKGSRISDLVCNLDPRAFTVYVTPDKPSEEEKRFPFIQPFWARTGMHGTLSIFDQGWYGRTLSQVSKRIDDEDALASLQGKGNVRKLRKTLDPFVEDIGSYERQFADDGYVILKFFLHISKKEQRKRLEQLAANEETAWRVTKSDFKHAKKYDARCKVLDQIFPATSTDHAPWCIVPSNDWRLANLVILKALVTAYERALRQRGLEVPRPSADFVLSYSQAEQHEGDVPAKAEELELAREMVLGAIRSYDEGMAEQVLAAGSPQDVPEVPSVADDLVSRFEVVEMPLLETVRHDLVLDQATYRKRLKEEQDRLTQNQYRLYHARIPMVIAFEGWDAAGKGGSIKRLARALDARDYRVVPSSSPSPEEKKHPFLWRYWTKLPKTGHVALYDRTWYGRVLVERVEGFATDAEWRRAYDEINEFEWALTRWGAIICKFWVNISEDEQLARFNARMENPDKQWKITDEDWRNREKNPQYQVAIDDMLRLTSTSYAPWTIVENDDKYYGRIKVLEIVNDVIEKRLGKD
ncbi:MAG: polyphosphate--AMP phosphotransferase [Actinomycetota bacterium]|nr:polyphosphate--AMP phosphotransferase [Actinomycetota bacterium]